MRTDALEIDRFYRSTRGLAAKEMVLRRLTSLWSNTRDLDMLGYGYATPYLNAFKDSARRTVAYMPAGQGAVPWGRDKGNCVALGEECRMPFVEGLFDRVILVHALEEAEDLRRLLREVWRIMAPEARLAVICTHRAGLWARVDSTPFGHGRPYTRTQLTRLLTDALFEPTAWAQALYTPPWRFSCGEKTADGFEAVGERVYPAFGGLILAEAVKHVGAVRPGGTAQRVRVTQLEKAGKRALSPTSETSTDQAKSKSAKDDAP